MPFSALGGDRDQVWQCLTTDGQPSKSKLTPRLCNLDPDLFARLQDADFRRAARRTLVGIYFSPTEQRARSLQSIVALHRERASEERRRGQNPRT